MPPKRAQCQICREKESKYTCSKCMVLYCSVPCYKQHKETGCAAASDAPAHPPDHGSAGILDSPGQLTNQSESTDRDPSAVTPDPSGDPSSPREGEGPNIRPPSPPLRPLTSLKWPYVPEESAYPDPLKRDDPKPLQLRQYEAIATSQAVRQALAAHPTLPELLRSIDVLRGEDRDDALQRALGVSPADVGASVRGRQGTYPEEDVCALRQLAEAVESAVRGGTEGALGLDWGD